MGVINCEIFLFCECLSQAIAPGNFVHGPTNYSIRLCLCLPILVDFLYCIPAPAKFESPCPLLEVKRSSRHVLRVDCVALMKGKWPPVAISIELYSDPDTIIATINAQRIS